MGSGIALGTFKLNFVGSHGTRLSQWVPAGPGSPNKIRQNIKNLQYNFLMGRGVARARSLMVSHKYFEKKF